MKRKGNFLTVFVILSLVLISNLYGHQTYQLKSPGFIIETSEDGYHRIIIDGFSSYGRAGYPDLPSRIYRAAVPPEVEPDSIEVRFSIQKMEYPGTFNVREIPPMMTWVDGRLITGDKADIYTKDDFFPGDCVEYVGFSRMRKWRIVTFKYTPFRYNPVTKELIFISQATVTIDYQLGDRSSKIELELQDPLMEKRAKRLLMNYDESLGWYRYTGEGGEWPSLTYDYVIVTTNAIESGSTKLSDFVTYLQGKGFSPLVITEDEYGGLIGQAPNGTAEKIRKWLQDNYISYGINYVLLIGNPDPDDPSSGSDSVGDIPMKMCWPRRDYSSYKEAPTDYFFADLTGNWDLDGDEYYGEWSDFTGTGGVDFMNEVYVGRIPVYSGITDLDSILQKTMNYGNSISKSWRSSALLPMSFSTSTYDGAPLAEQMKDDYLTGAGYFTWTQYQQGSGACGLDSIYPSDEELRGGTVVRDRWAANDYGLVLWWGHGSISSASVGCSGCWDGTLMNSSYASSLDNNHPSFVYMNSCTNGYPENSGNLQYAVLKNGGIGTVGATRVSWFNTGVGYGQFDGSTTNSGIGYEFASRIVANQPGGNALYHAKSSMTPTSNTRLMNFYDFNLYGDPAISIATYLQNSITVTSPNGGEYWQVGSTQHITWSSTGTVGNVKIEYSINNGSSWTEIAASTPNDGSYDWTIPDDPSDNCLVRVSEIGGQPVDVSNAVFSIVYPAEITITTPNGDEDWQVGSIHDITWTSTGTVDNVKIEYSINTGVSWIEIQSSVSNEGSYEWTIPDTPSIHCLVRVSDIDGYPSDVSDAVFSIYLPPSITVTSPNGGETWGVGSSHSITWTTTGFVGNVKIEYSINSGSSWMEIVSSTPNDGSYNWTIPDTPSDNCLVRVSETDGDPYDVSDEVFTIYFPPSITVTSPNGGETWEAGFSYPITWTSSGSVGNVKIEYSINSGASWIEVVSSTPNDGSYNWTIPDNPSDTCLVRVSETDGQPSDISDGPFTIFLPSITVIYPNGRESLSVGSAHEITWTSTGTIASVMIEYSTDGGITWKVIVNSTKNDGKYNWVVPDDPSGSCLVRIEGIDKDGGPWDISNGEFFIEPVKSPGITITSPNGGETLNAGSTHKITWTSSGKIDNVKIECSLDSGTSWTELITSTPNDGSYVWNITGASSETCLVRVSDSDGEPSDTSDGVFSIIIPSVITITSPNGGEILNAGSTHEVTWTSTGAIDNVTIEYSVNSGKTWLPIVSSVPNNGAFNWAIPGKPSENCLIRIWENRSDGGALDVSDAEFSINVSLYSSITIISPNGGETLYWGSTHEITWTSMGTTGNLIIECSTDSGSTWRTIVWSTADDGSYDWTVPNNPSEDCLIRISETDGEPADESDDVFKISGEAKPTITVISPNGGENLEVDSTVDITWTGTGSIDNVIIEYSIDGGASWADIVNSTANDGSYNWNVPDTPSENCLVRISGNDEDTSPWDVSNAVFSIVAPGSPTITVISPNGRETLTVGSTHEITWTTTGEVGDLSIEFSVDSGISWTIIVESTENNGSYDWRVPDTPSNNCLVRIREGYGDNSLQDTSNAEFSIVPPHDPVITVTFPNSGEMLYAGYMYEITWSGSQTIDNVKIEYSTDSGADWMDIIASTPNNGSYAWIVPEDPAETCLIRVSDRDGSPSDVSDALFSIALPPTITVTSPNGGESWEAGSSYLITWTTTGTVGNVAIDYSTDNGTTWTDIVESTENDGSYEWTAADTPSDNCLVRIWGGDTDPSPSDSSDAKFSIVPGTFDGGRQGYAYERTPDVWIKIPGVLITFVSEDGSVTKSVTTNGSGYYKISLSPQRYRVTAKHPDYHDYSPTGFVVVTGPGYSTFNIFLTKK